MAPEVEKKEEIVYKADPFAFVFRELDLMHNEIREIKVELTNVNRRLDSFMLDVNNRFDEVNKRFDDLYKLIISTNDGNNKRFDDVNKRFDDVNKRFDDVNKRFDRLYIIVILNLIGIVAFLIKEFFF